MGTFLLPQQTRSLNCLTVRGTHRQTAIKALISIHVCKWQLAWTTVTWGLIEGRLSITFMPNGKRDLYHTFHQISTHELVVSQFFVHKNFLSCFYRLIFFGEILNLNMTFAVRRTREA